MNPFRLVKLYRQLSLLVRLFQQATASYERTDVSKSLFASKTFWFNALTATAELLQLLAQVNVIPPGVLTIIAGVVNIGLRVITDTPVHVIEK